MLVLEKTPAQLFSKKLTSIKFSQLIIEDLNKLSIVCKREIKESYLLNSYVMNLVAAWQIYIEDLLEFGINKMIDTSTNNEVNLILKTNFEARKKKFNNPSTGNIDTLFKEVIGIDKITSQVNNSEVIKNKINDIINIRHEIAHKGYSKSSLTISDNFDKMYVLLNAAQELQNIVKIYVSKYQP